MEQGETTAPFAHKKIDTCTLGARLQTLREVEKLTQEDVARASRVRVEYVRALEEGRFDDLPAPVYVRGFLRMIARVLRTHEKQLITLYDREVGITQNVHKKNHTQQQATGPLAQKIYLYRSFLTPRHVVSVVAGVFVLGGVFYLYTVLHSFVSAPFVVVAAPQDGATVQSADIVVQGTTDPAAVLTVNGEEVVVGQDGHFETHVFVQEGVNEITLVATNRFDKTTQKTVSVRYTNPQPQPRAVTPEAVPETVTLTVRIVTARTWLNVRVDGEVVLTQTVDAGFEQTFEGKEIVITSGGGARTLVSRDGGDFAPLADVPGLVKDVRFAREVPTPAADTQQDKNVVE